MKIEIDKEAILAVFRDSRLARELCHISFLSLVDLYVARNENSELVKLVLEFKKIE